MSAEGSVSRWLGRLKDGEADAAQKLWERYFRRLVGLARLRLQNAPRRAADEEDVALSAFASFYRGVEEARFPLLEDRDDLWRILVILTTRKASLLVRDEGRLKRGGLSVAVGPDVLAELLGDEPTPEFAAEAADECRRLFALLADANLEAVAVACLEGYTVSETALQLGCSPRTVERRLALIRDIWRSEVTA